MKEFVKRHGSKMLTGVSIVGVVLTTCLATKATIKAVNIIEDIECEYNIKLNKKDIFNITWKLYIPTFISGMTTILSILSIEVLHQKQQQTLSTAYATLYTTFEKYRNEIKEKYGKEVDAQTYVNITRNRLDALKDVDTYGKEWFYDARSGTFYLSTFDEVSRKGEEFIESIQNRGYGLLNEYYNLIGIPEVDYGYSLGWNGFLEDCDPYGCYKLDFSYELVHVENGLDFWLVDFSTNPVWNYI